MGLIYGKGRTGCGRVTCLTLGTLQEELHATIPTDTKRAVDKMFFDQNRACLERQSTSFIPWYLPRWCGGLGLKHSLEKPISPDDLLRAAYVKKFICARGESIQPYVRKDWLVHSIVTRKMMDQWGWLLQPFSKISIDSVDYNDLELEDSKVYNNLVLGALINAESIDELYKVSGLTSDHEYKAIKTLNRKWQKIDKCIRREECFDLKPMDPEDLLLVNPSQFYPIVCY
jgi:hypothetical protein